MKERPLEKNCRAGIVLGHAHAPHVHGGVPKTHAVKQSGLSWMKGGLMRRVVQRSVFGVGKAYRTFSCIVDWRRVFLSRAKRCIV